MWHLKSTELVKQVCLWHYLFRYTCPCLVLAEMTWFQGCVCLSFTSRRTSLFVEIHKIVAKHTHTQTLFADSWLDIMMRLLNCWKECKFLEINLLMGSKITLSMTAIDCANAYLTLAQGPRCFVVGSACLFLPPLCTVCVNVMFGGMMRNKMARQESDYCHLRTIWML